MGLTCPTTSIMTLASSKTTLTQNAQNTQSQALKTSDLTSLDGLKKGPPKPELSTLQSLNWVFKRTQKHRLKLIATLVAMIVLGLTEPAIPYLFKVMVDEAVIAQNQAMVILIPLALAGLFLLRSITSFISIVLGNWVAKRVINDIRLELFNHFLKLKQIYLDKKGVSKTLSKMIFDVEQISESVIQVWVVLIRDSVSVVGLLGFIFYVNWQISSILLIGVPIILWLYRTISKRMTAVSLSIQQRMGELTQRTDESLNALRLIKIYGLQSLFNKDFAKSASSFRQQQMKLVVANEMNSGFIQLIVAILVCFILHLALKQGMTAGSLVAYVGAMAILFPPIKRLSAINQNIQRAKAAVHSVQSIFDQPLEQDRQQSPKKQPHQDKPMIKGLFEFKNLNFHYPSKTPKPIFHNLSLEIKPHQSTALVGPSGSGKTTLIQLMMRFYDFSKENIFLDGLDLNHYSLNHLRQSIAYVGQHTFLFDDTIKANLLVGNPKANEQSIKEVLSDCEALDFVQNLKKGMNTVIGERGMRLSGGQRQRLAIARALLKPAPILILDEATSALDSPTERKVQEAIFKKRQNQTTILIAHRLSTIEKADHILVLEGGRLCEQGNHSQLMAKKGLYHSLVQSHQE